MKTLTFDETRDFPYYNHNPRISKSAWFILLLLIPISFLAYMIVESFSEMAGSIVFCFTLLIPLLYYSKWDYSLIFHKPTKNEIILAVLMFAGYMIYAVIIGECLDLIGLAGPSDSIPYDVDWEMIVSLIFSMMGEELIKFIPLMFFMRVIFKYSHSRKLSIIISTILVLIGFGLIHYDPFSNTLASVLLLQGAGSMFEMYGYLKTKNLFVSYLSHFLTDAFVFILIIFGFS